MMWDLQTIKHLNERKQKGQIMSKLWRYMEAWKKFLKTKNN
tara:strand:- start:2097 stop:2219 length:123 start_codon:yes stop_codon:yes gene_type:complete